jgi:hypothetical protein
MKPLNDDGPSKIVPIRMSESEKAEVLAACENGESLSAFVRDAVKARVKLKWKQRKAKRK